jgi:TPR repeat protein
MAAPAPQYAAAAAAATAATLPPAHPHQHQHHAPPPPQQQYADPNQQQQVQQQQPPPQQQQQQQQQQPVSLRLAVREAVSRWFLDTLAEAQRGDPKQQALLAAMYDQGYGCSRNPRAAREWAERAAQRGYRMSGVYCTNP